MDADSSSIVEQDLSCLELLVEDISENHALLHSMPFSYGGTVKTRHLSDPLEMTIDQHMTE